MTQSLSRLYLLYQKTMHYFNLLRSVALRFGNRHRSMSDANNIQDFLKNTRDSVWWDLLNGVELSEQGIKEIFDSKGYIAAVRLAREDNSEGKTISQPSIPSMLKEINTLLEAVPAIQAMRMAKEKEENPILAATALREKLGEFGESTLKAIYSLDELAHARREGLRITPFRKEATSEHRDQVNTQVKQLDALREMLGTATHQPSFQDKIVEAMALFRQNPAKTVKSEITSAAEKVAQGALNSLKAVPVVGWIVQGGEKVAQAFSNSMEYMKQARDKDR
ncbi:MAG: hypothetical protein ACK59C_00110 [Holosporales bacterium]